MSVTQTENGGGSYKENIDGAAIMPNPGPQNIRIYVTVNLIMLILQLLGGWAGYKFFGNLFLGGTIILALVSLAMVTMEPNKRFAENHTWGWWSFTPVILGFISLGFSWYFCWLVWWGIALGIFIKKTIGDKEIADAALPTSTAETVSTPLRTDAERYNEVLRQVEDGEL